MSLLGDVRSIKNENLAPPTDSTSEHSSDSSESSSASVKSAIIETITVVVHDWKPSLLETVAK